MVASIGAVASPAQGVSYYERDGYYAQEDPAHREASAWAGKGAEALGLSGSVDPDIFSGILEGTVPDGSGRRLGRRLGDGTIDHRPGRDVTFSAPKSVSIAALLGGDARIVAAHDAAVQRTLGWIEENVVQTRTMDAESGRMVRTGGQKAVIAAFRHEVSRNLDPQLHTHAVIANMVQGGDAKWRTMANEKLYASKMLIGALYRAELARGLEELGYGIEKTHADGRFEIAGASGRSPVPRSIVEAFSTRRAEIKAAMAAQGLGNTAQDQRLAQRAALMTRAHKREVDRHALRESWRRQAADLGFDARELVDEARHRQAAHVGRPLAPAGRDREAEPGVTAEADRAVAWAVAHLSEREAVFSRTDLLTSALAWNPGKVSIGEAEAAVAQLEKAGTLLAANHPVPGDSLTTDMTVADERETIALMERGQRRVVAPMRGRAVDKALRNGPLTAGQKEAVKLILSGKDRVVGVQGYAGTGKTTMLNRARALLEKRGFEVTGLAPSASAARTLDADAGIASETLQGFLARNAGVAEDRLSRRGEQAMKARFRKTVLVVDEGSLASTAQTRDLLRIANTLRIPRVVLVGDEKQLDAVDAGKPFAQLQAAGMKCAVMDEIVRQREPTLKEAVEASLAGDIGKAFKKLGDNVAEVRADNLAGAAAARWLALSPEERQVTGLMAPSHALREKINAMVRERLIRDGVIDGPAMDGERLVSRGYTNAEKGACRELRPGRCRGLPPPLQASRGRQGRRTLRRRCRPGGGCGHAPGQARRCRRLGTRKAGGAARRGGGLRRGRHGASPGRPSMLDPQRQEARTGEQRRGGGDGGRRRCGRVPAGGRADADAAQKRSPAAPCRPGLGGDRARVPGPHRGPGDRGDGGGARSPDHPEDLLRGDRPRTPSRRARDRRPPCAARAPGSGDGRAHRGARGHRAVAAGQPGKGWQGQAGGGAHAAGAERRALAAERAGARAHAHRRR